MEKVKYMNKVDERCFSKNAGAMKVCDVVKIGENIWKG